MVIFKAVILSILSNDTSRVLCRLSIDSVSLTGQTTFSPLQTSRVQLTGLT